MKKIMTFLFLFVFCINCSSQIRNEESDGDIQKTTIREGLAVFIPNLKAHQTDKTVSFAYATDLHNKAFGTSYSKNIITEKIANVNYSLNIIKDSLKLDCLVLGGDYIWNTTETSKEAAIDALKAFSETVKVVDLPTLCLKGNHDENTLAGYENSLTKYDFYENCASFFKHPHIEIDNDNYTGCYGYYDCEQQKVRFIYLNTCDVPLIIEKDDLKYKSQWDTGIRQEQLNFIVKALIFSEPGWGVVILSHHAITSIKGYDISNLSYIDQKHGGEQLYGIINAFKNKGKYKSEVAGDFSCSIDVDFSGNRSNEIICLINGHTHCDRNAVKDGILFCSSTSATLGNSKNTNSDGSLFVSGEDKSDIFAFDIVTIDREKGTLYFDRFGFGNSRELSYSNN